MGYAVNHKLDVKFNKSKFQEILQKKNIKAKDVFQKTIQDHGLDINTKSFYNLTNNQVHWNLIYAICLSKTLKEPIENLFTLEKAV